VNVVDASAHERIMLFKGSLFSVNEYFNKRSPGTAQETLEAFQ